MANKENLPLLVATLSNLKGSLSGDQANVKDLRNMIESTY